MTGPLQRTEATQEDAMAQNILVIDGHPDSASTRYCHALAIAYAEGARTMGKQVRLLKLADLTVEPLRNAQEFAAPPQDAGVLAARDDLKWAAHIVLVFPLWMGAMPARLRAFFEQAARGGFVAEVGAMGWKPHLRGKSARIIVTMGMPVFAYRLMFGGHGVKALERSILGFAGMGPIRETLFGAIEAVDDAERLRRIEHVRALGERGI
jgi:putative NADPH-quinone reductase